MAEKAKVAAPEQQNDDVMTVIRKGGLIKQTMTAEVEAEIEKEKDERIKQQMKDRILRASYRRLLKRLQLRLRRSESAITLDILKKSEILEDRLKGFELTEDKIKLHGGKDGKLSIEIINETGSKETKEFALPKKGEKVWVPGGITIAEYDDKFADLRNEEAKKFQEADTNHRKEREELENQYPNYFRYDWRW